MHRRAVLVLTPLVASVLLAGLGPSGAVAAPVDRAAVSAKLSKAELRAARLTRDDLPAGWKPVPVQRLGAATGVTTEPADCIEPFRTHDDRLRRTRAAFAHAKYDVLLVVEVATHADRFVKADSDASFAVRVERCGVHTATDSMGETAEVSLRSLRFRQFGGATYGFQERSADIGPDGSSGDTAVFATGHNSVTVQLVGSRSLPRKQRAEIVRAAVRKLKSTGS